jgi:hypothetical protein
MPAVKRRLSGLFVTCIHFSISYQRNQVVWALARIITPKPSLAFERDVALKVQRLIDRDRATVMESSQKGYAFLDDELPGKGTAASFTEETAFLLLLGVLLLDSGLTQSRVVRVNRDLKDGICKQYEWIISLGEDIHCLSRDRYPEGQHPETVDRETRHGRTRCRGAYIDSRIPVSRLPAPEKHGWQNPSQQMTADHRCVRR